MDLVVHQVVQLQHVDVADRDLAVEGLAGLPVDQSHLAARIEARELQHLDDVDLVGAVEHWARHRDAASVDLAELRHVLVRHRRDLAVGLAVAVVNLGQQVPQRAVGRAAGRLVQDLADLEAEPVGAHPRWVSRICPTFILEGTPKGLSTMSTLVPSSR